MVHSIGCRKSGKITEKINNPYRQSNKEIADYVALERIVLAFIHAELDVTFYINILTDITDFNFCSQTIK